MNEDLISVIVPCYNVEKYVSMCIESLINQTYSNLEIILVDDCGTDNTAKILREYVKKDKRIKLIKNEKNSGLSFSRNVGLKEANGNYIGFIDSDDYVSLDFYEKLMQSIKKNHSQVAICDMKIVYEETNEEQLSKCYTGNKFSLINVINNGLAASACNKLFKKEIISKYEFEVGKVNEDIAVVIPALVNSKKISYAKDVYYYYIQRGGSIQNSGFSDKRFDIFYGVDTTLDRINGSKNYEEIKESLIYNQIIVLLIYLIPKIKKFNRRKYVLKRYNELATKYSIRRNHYFWNFLESSGMKHRLYYKLLFKLTCNKLYFFANVLIGLYNFLYKILTYKKFKKTVIENDIDLESVIKNAKYQNSLKDEPIKVSVIVPNYNYARFMYQRIYSILKQNYKIYELIILDDMSSDNSIEVIDEIVESIKEYVNIKTIYNKTNGGSAFKQWQKGFDIATGDYIWIAEADDYCKRSLLNNLIKPVTKNDNIRISYCDTAFIDVDGHIILKSIKPEIDIQKSNHWNSSYTNNGLKEIKNYSFLNNTIANVSSCIIKKDNYSSILRKAGSFHQAGDWLIYVDIMAKGDISYIDKPINYYRLHGNNVSSTMNHQKHLDELNRLYNYYIKKYNLNNSHKKKIDKRKKFLKKVWGLDDN